jgi:hypothetical protein
LLLNLADMQLQDKCCAVLMYLAAAAAAGSLVVNDSQLQARDAAKVKAGDDTASLLKLSTAEGAHFMLIEMAKSNDD